MLTAKQMKFVAEVSEGGSQSNAYRKAYDTSQMAPKTIWEEASRLRRHPKVAARIEELEAEKEARRRMQALSREDRVLQELEKIAFGDGPASGRLKALELLGKHVGLFKPKEVPVVERSVEDISNQLQRRLEDLLD
jgi:phage terminase small subunit